MATLNDLQSQVQSLEAQLLELRGELARGGFKPYSTEWEAVQQRIRSLESQVIGIQNDIAAGRYTDPAAGTASSGQVVSNAQTAKDDGATTQDPQTPQGRIVKAADVNQNLETGTNAPVKKLEQTQATPPANPNSDTPTVSTEAGATGRPDDNPGANKNTTQQTVNANFSQKITPKPNVLDMFASYTYSLTWYLITPEQYNLAQRQQRKAVNNWSILVQSGGAPVQPEAADQAGRNQFFNVDYYIDNLSITHNYSGKGSGGATNHTDIKFQITEPNGITFIPNLANAVQTLYKTMQPPMDGVWTQAQYCMVIRFYGYDEAGNLIQVGRSGALGKNNASDPKAAVEKFIFFAIKNVTTKIHSKQIVYEVEAAPLTEGTGLSQNRGTIPFSYQLTGTTVGEVIGGKAYKPSTATAGRQDTATDTPAAYPRPENATGGYSDTTGMDFGMLSG